MGIFRIAQLPLSVLFLLIIISSVDANISALLPADKRSVITAYVIDGHGNKVVKDKGIIVAVEGVIATDYNLLSKWFEDIENRIVVKTYYGEYIYAGRLIASNRRIGIALFEVQAKNLTAAARLPAGHRITAYIERQLARYRRIIDAERKTAITPPLKPDKQIVVEYPPVKLPKPEKKPEEKIEQKRTYTAYDYFIIAINYENANKYKEAVEAYAMALKMNSDFTEAYINIGLLYFRLGRYSDAVDAYRHALRLKPYSASVYIKLGTAYITLAEYSNALDAFKQAAMIKPYDPAIRFHLAIAYFLNGDRKSAFDEYVRLKRLDKKRALHLFKLIN
jgi:tetratricopeptide (TPR) repeat protein